MSLSNYLALRQYNFGGKYPEGSFWQDKFFYLLVVNVTCTNVKRDKWEEKDKGEEEE